MIRIDIKTVGAKRRIRCSVKGGFEKNIQREMCTFFTFQSYKKGGRSSVNSEKKPERLANLRAVLPNLIQMGHGGMGGGLELT